MAPADVDAGMVRRNERHCNADVLALSEKILGIEQAEREADQRRLGAEGDIALVPRKTDAEHFLAIVDAARHRADIAHGRGIRA
jgi:hypothetical protein